MRKIYMILAMISILVSPVIAMDNQSNQNNTIYRTSVNQHDGFYIVYQVIDGPVAKIANYQNRTLNISRGDTIIWINSDNQKFTITSEQNLWDNKSGFLADEYKQFSYTFTNTGIYDVYINETPKYRQKIIVGPIESNLTDLTNISNVEPNATSTTNVSDAEPNSTSTNVTNISNVESNSTSTNVTNISNVGSNSTSTNVTNISNVESNSTSNVNVEPSPTNVTPETKITILNKSNMIPIVISISPALYDNIKSRLDTIVLTFVLLSIFLFSRRIKDD